MNQIASRLHLIRSDMQSQRKRAAHYRTVRIWMYTQKRSFDQKARVSLLLVDKQLILGCCISLLLVGGRVATTIALSGERRLWIVIKPIKSRERPLDLTTTTTSCDMEIRQSRASLCSRYYIFLTKFQYTNYFNKRNINNFTAWTLDRNDDRGRRCKKTTIKHKEIERESLRAGELVPLEILMRAR